MGALMVTTVHARQENGEHLIKAFYHVEIKMHWLNGSAENHVVIVIVRQHILYLF